MERIKLFDDVWDARANMITKGVEATERQLSGKLVGEIESDPEYNAAVQRLEDSQRALEESSASITDLVE